MRIRWFFVSQVSHDAGNASDFEFQPVNHCFVITTRGEALFRFRKDFNLYNARLRSGYKIRQGRERGLGTDVFYYGKQNAVGEVRGQRQLLLEFMVFSIFRLVANNHLTGARVDPCLHRLRERRPLLDEVVLEQTKSGFLRELAGVLVNGTIAKTEYQVIRDDVALRGYGAFSFRESLVVEAAQGKKAVGEAFLLTYRHLVSSPG